LPDVIKVIVLGIVQGITEYLPVSSTGHLIVAAALLDFGAGLGGTFEIFIQVGSVVAVLIFYRAELWQQVRAVRTDAGVRRFWWGVALAFVPAAAIGFLLKDWIKSGLYSPVVVAISLIVGGVAFLIIERTGLAEGADTHQITDIRPLQALGIGLAQCIALIPGVSRSGASIIGGMLVKLDRPTATRFSFFLAIPTLGGATLYDLLTSLDRLQPGDMVNLLLGAGVAALVSLAAMGWLLRYVARNDFTAFGFYRMVIGGVILLLIAASTI